MARHFWLGLAKGGKNSIHQMYNIFLMCQKATHQRYIKGISGISKVYQRYIKGILGISKVYQRYIKGILVSKVVTKDNNQLKI